MNDVICGDCLDVLKDFPDKSVDLIFTSPPYADRRKSVYGGISENLCVDWFIPIARELYRVLSDSGSFFLNIKPHTQDGERVLYVFDLVLTMKRAVGFRFVDEFCWKKIRFLANYIEDLRMRLSRFIVFQKAKILYLIVMRVLLP